MLIILTKPTHMLIALGWAAYLIYWVVSAVRARPQERARNWALTFLMMIAVSGLVLLLNLGFVADNLNVVLWQATLLSDIGSDIVVLMGLFILIWARRSLGLNWSASVAIEKGHELVQNGPYRYVRHPIYSGFLTMVLGTAIAYGHLVGMIILATCIAGLYFKARREEALLKVRFPDAYPQYVARTKTLIPFIL